MRGLLLFWGFFFLCCTGTGKVPVGTVLILIFHQILRKDTTGNMKCEMRGGGEGGNERMYNGCLKKSAHRLLPGTYRCVPYGTGTWYR